MTDIIANLVITLINVALVALNLKMYTEYFKDKAITRRQP